MIIKIETDNAAFQDGNMLTECRRMIEAGLTRLEDINATAPAHIALRDFNGNTCGAIQLN